jgi:hypothetical protein
VNEQNRRNSIKSSVRILLQGGDLEKVSNVVGVVGDGIDLKEIVSFDVVGGSGGDDGRCCT